MKIKRGEVCIFIPTLNEAPTIGDLIREFREQGFEHILVMDGNSSDGTPDIARAAGATVRTQTGKGKGNAIIEAVEIIDEPYALMLDGDGTYSPEDADKMLDPLAQTDLVGRGNRGFVGDALDAGLFAALGQHFDRAEHEPRWGVRHDAPQQFVGG